MTSAARVLVIHRRMLWATTVQDVRRRFAGTVLGMTWAIFYPLVFLALYAAVYTLVFRIKPNDLETNEYVLFLFAGLVPFLGFSEALGLGVTSVTSNRGLVRNTLFPIELIPVKATLVGSLSMFVGLVVLQSALWLRGIVHLSQLVLPLVIFLQLIFTVGVVWLCSSVQVFLKDLSHIVSVGVMFLMFASPIAYTVEMVPADLWPLLYLNPLYYLLALYRGCVLAGQVPIVPLISFCMISAGTFLVGFFVFSRFKALFPEYV